MTAIHHTPLDFGGPLTQAAMEGPLSQLDAAIAAVNAALGLAVAAGSSTSTTLTAQANAGQASLVVASSAGVLVGDHIYIGNGATFETRIVSVVPDATHLTVSVNLTNTYAIGKPVSKSPVEIVEARSGLATLNTRLGTLVGAVSGKAFGAIGDNVADDTAAIQAALTSVAPGGAVYLGPGSYLVTALTMSNAGVRLHGAGPSTVIRIAGNTDAITISAARCIVSDLSISAPTANTTTSRGIVSTADDTVIERVRFVGSNHVIVATAGTRGRIHGCEILTYLREGILLTGAAVTDWQIIGNRIHDGLTWLPAAGFGGAIHTILGGGHVIADNEIRDIGGNANVLSSLAGINLEDSSFNAVTGNRVKSIGRAGLYGQGILCGGNGVAGGSHHNTVTGNVVEDCNQEGITCWTNGSRFNAIVGNTVRNPVANGIEIFDTLGDNIVQGNYVEGAGSSGIYVGSTTAGGASPRTLVDGNIVRLSSFNGISVNDSPNTTVSNNIVTDNNRATRVLSYEGSGIVFTGASANCILIGNLSTDTAPAGKKQLYGVDLENTSSVIGGNNRLVGNLTGAIQNRQLASGSELGIVEYPETSDPAATADQGRVYARDNGAGKTQLCVRFATGAIQILATEP